MEMTLEEFVLAALLGSFALVALFTLISRTSRLGVEKRAIRNRIVCRLCLHSFEDHGSHPTPECPACQALNERKQA
jgi:hypothetical protein